MAWRSSGSNNNEMVDNLKRFAVITSQTIEQGFRSVDRKFFVPQDHESIAHADQPLKEGNIHISAPHIYGSALEALELLENSSLSFLNIGSGTGYLSCIVASILGPYSTNYGIEIHQDVVQHSLEAISKWKIAFDGKIPHLEVIHGNALNISMDEGEALVGFDRIYLGAAIDQEDLPKLISLLKPGGVLVGPVGDELLKIVRIKNTSSIKSSDDLATQVISGVRFASLVSTPDFKTVLPSRVWRPSIHQSYPESFRLASKELMLCSHSSYEQPLPEEVRMGSQINLAAILPRFVWMEILSYTHRNWFEPPHSDENFLRHRLKEEQINCRRAHEARMEAEARCQTAERERDVYRMLARRWQSRIQVLLQQQNRNNSTDNTFDINMEDGMMNYNRRETSVIFGLGAMLGGFTSDSDEDLESSEDEGDMETDQTDQGQHQHQQALEQESSDDNYAFFSEDDEIPEMEESESASSLSESDVDKISSNLPSATKTLSILPQGRNISTSDDV